MRIEKPYTRDDRYSTILLDGNKIDTVVACDDYEGWIDSFRATKTERGAYKVELDEDRNPILDRLFGQVTIIRP